MPITRILARLKETATKEYKYAMVNRPAGMATCPKGFIRLENRPSKDEEHYDYARNGVAIYDRELTDHETKSFEMAPMLESEDRKAFAEKVAKTMSKYAKGYIEIAEDNFAEFTSDMPHRVKIASTGYPPSVGDWSQFAKLVLENLKREI